MRDRSLLGSLLLIGSVGFGVSGAMAAESPEPHRELAELAEKFSKQFLDGRHEQNLELMTDQMREASGPEASEKLRASLVAQHGAFSEIGSARFQDKVQAYLRFRVPIHFEHQSIDFMIVFDLTGKLAGFFLMPYSGPPRPGEPAPGEEIEVLVGEGDRALPGTIALPEGPGPFPAVVLIHGSGPLDRNETIGPNKPFRDLAWGLAEQGIASLRYDKRSYAQPETLAVLGDALTAREGVIDDARLALALLRGRGEIDRSRVFLLGHSLGGMLLPRIASADPAPAGMISLAGSTLPLPEKIYTQSLYIVSLDGNVSPEERQQVENIEREVLSIRAALDGKGPAPEGMPLGYPFGFYQDIEQHDPAAEAAKLGLPILVLQGKRDYQVTMEDFEGWQAALAGKPFACAVAYDDLDHLFRAGNEPSTPEDYFARQAPVAPRVIQDIANWIKRGDCPK
jgi:dienelactone hydrolase